MAKLRVIFVHGMAGHLLAEKDIDPTYFINLRDALIRELKHRGVVPKDAVLHENSIEGIVTFDFVNYSDIGQAEEERVLEVYREAKRTLFGLLDKALDIAFEHARIQLVTAFSDVLVYRSDHWRETIRGRLLEKINPHIGKGEAVSIVAHSLGSAVAFDTIYYNSNVEPWKDADFKPTNLFTMGSPIALFTLEPRPLSPRREDLPPEDGRGEESDVPEIPPWQEVLRANEAKNDAEPPAQPEDGGGEDDPGGSDMPAALEDTGGELH